MPLPKRYMDRRILKLAYNVYKYFSKEAEYRNLTGREHKLEVQRQAAKALGINWPFLESLIERVSFFGLVFLTGKSPVPTVNNSVDKSTQTDFPPSPAKCSPACNKIKIVRCSKNHKKLRRKWWYMRYKKAKRSASNSTDTSDLAQHAVQTRSEVNPTAVEENPRASSTGNEISTVTPPKKPTHTRLPPEIPDPIITLSASILNCTNTQKRTTTIEDQPIGVENLVRIDSRVNTSSNSGGMLFVNNPSGNSESVISSRNQIVSENAGQSDEQIVPNADLGVAQQNGFGGPKANTVEVAQNNGPSNLNANVGVAQQNGFGGPRANTVELAQNNGPSNVNASLSVGQQSSFVDPNDNIIDLTDDNDTFVPNDDLGDAQQIGFVGPEVNDGDMDQYYDTSLPDCIVTVVQHSCIVGPKVKTIDVGQNNNTVITNANLSAQQSGLVGPKANNVNVIQNNSIVDPNTGLSVIQNNGTIVPNPNLGVTQQNSFGDPKDNFIDLTENESSFVPNADIDVGPQSSFVGPKPNNNDVVQNNGSSVSNVSPDNAQESSFVAQKAAKDATENNTYKPNTNSEAGPSKKVIPKTGNNNKGQSVPVIISKVKTNILKNSRPLNSKIVQNVAQKKSLVGPKINPKLPENKQTNEKSKVEVAQINTSSASKTTLEIAQRTLPYSSKTKPDLPDQNKTACKQNIGESKARMPGRPKVKPVCKQNANVAKKIMPPRPHSRSGSIKDRLRSRTRAVRPNAPLGPKINNGKSQYNTRARSKSSSDARTSTPSCSGANPVEQSLLKPNIEGQQSDQICPKPPDNVAKRTLANKSKSDSNKPEQNTPGCSKSNLEGEQNMPLGSNADPNNAEESMPVTSQPAIVQPSVLLNSPTNSGAQSKPASTESSPEAQKVMPPGSIANPKVQENEQPSSTPTIVAKSSLLYRKKPNLAAQQNNSSCSKSNLNVAETSMPVGPNDDGQEKPVSKPLIRVVKPSVLFYPKNNSDNTQTSLLKPSKSIDDASKPVGPKDNLVVGQIAMPLERKTDTDSQQNTRFGSNAKNDENNQNNDITAQNKREFSKSNGDLATDKAKSVLKSSSPVGPPAKRSRSEDDFEIAEQNKQISKVGLAKRNSPITIRSEISATQKNVIIGVKPDQDFGHKSKRFCSEASRVVREHVFTNDASTQGTSVLRSNQSIARPKIQFTSRVTYDVGIQVEPQYFENNSNVIKENGTSNPKINNDKQQNTSTSSEKPKAQINKPISTENCSNTSAQTLPSNTYIDEDEPMPLSPKSDPDLPEQTVDYSSPRIRVANASVLFYPKDNSADTQKNIALAPNANNNISQQNMPACSENILSDASMPNCSQAIPDVASIDMPSGSNINPKVRSESILTEAIMTICSPALRQPVGQANMPFGTQNYPGNQQNMPECDNSTTQVAQPSVLFFPKDNPVFAQTTASEASVPNCSKTNPEVAQKYVPFVTKNDLDIGAQNMPVGSEPIHNEAIMTMCSPGNNNIPTGMKCDPQNDSVLIQQNGPEYSKPIIRATQPSVLFYPKNNLDIAQQSQPVGSESILTEAIMTICSPSHNNVPTSTPFGSENDFAVAQQNNHDYSRPGTQPSVLFYPKDNLDTKPILTESITIEHSFTKPGVQVYPNCNHHGTERNGRTKSIIHLAQTNMPGHQKTNIDVAQNNKPNYPITSADIAQNQTPVGPEINQAVPPQNKQGFPKVNYDKIQENSLLYAQLTSNSVLPSMPLLNDDLVEEQLNMPGCSQAQASMPVFQNPSLDATHSNMMLSPKTDPDGPQQNSLNSSKPVVYLAHVNKPNGPQVISNDASVPVFPTANLSVAQPSMPVAPQVGVDGTQQSMPFGLKTDPDGPQQNRSDCSKPTLYLRTNMPFGQKSNSVVAQPTILFYPKPDPAVQENNPVCTNPVIGDTNMPFDPNTSQTNMPHANKVDSGNQKDKMLYFITYPDNIDGANQTGNRLNVAQKSLPICLKIIPETAQENGPSIPKPINAVEKPIGPNNNVMIQQNLPNTIAVAPQQNNTFISDANDQNNSLIFYKSNIYKVAEPYKILNQKENLNTQTFTQKNQGITLNTVQSTSYCPSNQNIQQNTSYILRDNTINSINQTTSMPQQNTYILNNNLNVVNENMPVGQRMSDVAGISMPVVQQNMPKQNINVTQNINFVCPNSNVLITDQMKPAYSMATQTVKFTPQTVLLLPVAQNTADGGQANTNMMNSEVSPNCTYYFSKAKLDMALQGNQNSLRACRGPWYTKTEG
ncbi:uncharacterized protein LOC142985304 [Anticarsia gemmatalis]|uniref:uncharacterized protein LOC142985304 n=1 Tax=Anticarsia gemmatalis TaxID=129554 RepID=UPI003F76E8DD